MYAQTAKYTSWKSLHFFTAYWSLTNFYDFFSIQLMYEIGIHIKMGLRLKVKGKYRTQCMHCDILSLKKRIVMQEAQEYYIKNNSVDKLMTIYVRN